MLLRAHGYYTDAYMVGLYKAPLLSYLEYRTPAIYHWKQDVLDKLDHVQTRFLRDIGIDERTALLTFNLAPLSARRDMAMLGVIQGAVLEKGPKHFAEHFLVETGRKLHDPRLDYPSRLISRSALGLAAPYNLLPAGITAAKSVSSFQSRLQAEMKMRAEARIPVWPKTFSPRTPLDTNHPLVLDGIAPLIWN